MLLHVSVAVRVGPKYRFLAFDILSCHCRYFFTCVRVSFLSVFINSVVLMGFIDGDVVSAIFLFLNIKWIFVRFCKQAGMGPARFFIPYLAHIALFILDFTSRAY